LTDTEIVEGRRGALRVVLLAIIALALLLVAGTLGWLVRGGSSAAMPSATSVDAGFAQDMAIHHTQAVTMAGYERDNTSSSQLRVLAFDIETSQQFQIGEMQGWLDNWRLSRNNPRPMAWMGHDHMAMQVNGLMPGMATPAQMTKLEKSHGKALDILFLQLMIRHHQGGIPMARYAQQHAQEPYVRNLAAQMVNAQSAEIVQMEQILRQLGGTTLPAPTE
jgi:uncharacterized protein (DUF305 family)